MVEPPQNVLSYVSSFRHRLYVACEMTKEKLASSQVRLKRLFDRRVALVSLLNLLNQNCVLILTWLVLFFWWNQLI